MTNDTCDYEEEGYVSLWLGRANSEDAFYEYIELNYEEEETDEIPFVMGRDFNLDWYDEDLCDAAFCGDMPGYELLNGLSYEESFVPALKEKYKDELNNRYNSVIALYDIKYDGSIPESRNEQYGSFRFLGAFPYTT